MAEIQHSFIKGMNRDLSKNKFPNDSYYYLLNGRVMNDDNSTLSDIVNLKGNTEANINDNSIDRSTCSIIGYTTMKDDIILFYAENVEIIFDNPTTASYIDRLVYQGSDTYLRQQIWGGLGMNFRTDKPIRAASIYESENVQKIYWTDNNNPFRQANIAENISGQTVDQFDIQGNLTSMFAPSFNDFTSGSLRQGSICYAYRLIKKNGYKTVFSDVSDLIPLGKNIQYGTWISRSYGDPLYNPDSAYNTGKGTIINISITNSDYDAYYDFIEVVSLWYSSSTAIPDINIIEKISIKDNIDTYKVIDSGTVSYGTLTLAEFIEQSYSFIAKDLVSKDNRLFVANIKEEYFDIDEEATWVGKIEGDEWDSRAYRFDSTSKSELIHNGSVSDTLYGPTPNYNVNSKYDCINIYNNVTSNVLDELNSTGHKQMYQVNGTTLGGSGLNIKYSFTTENYYIAGHVNLSPAIVGSLDNDYQLGIKKGFQRDEVYRFGIVFYDKKGRSSFVKWIGDIRIPYPQNNTTGTIFANSTAYNILPVFTINNIPEINNEPLDYQIVYVKREESDKGVVAAGMIKPTVRFDNGTRPLTMPCTIAEYVADAGDVVGELNKLLLNFISPEINFRPTEQITGTFLQVSQARLLWDNGIEAPITDDMVWNYNNDTMSGGASAYIRKYGTLCYNFQNITEARIGINDIKKTPPSTSINYAVSIGADTYFNYGHCNNGGSVSAPHGTCLTMRMDNEISSSNDGYFYGYLRKNVFNSAYGGNDYVSRQLNTYIPASSKISGNVNTVTCYKGDTLITMFEYGEYFYQDQADGANNSFVTYNYFPCESSINCLLNTNDTFSRKYFIYPNRAAAHINENAYVHPDTGLSFTGMYGRNSAYDKLEDSKKFVCKPVLFQNIDEFSTRVKYSDSKVINEDIDSWLNFRPNNFNTANSNYGPINRLIEFTDKIYSFQNNGISLISINPRVIQQSTDGVTIILGSGEVIDKFHYLTTNIGCQDNSDIIKSFSALYWLDKNKRKIYTFNGQIESITDLKGLHSYLKNNVYESSSFIGTYDVANSEVLMTVKDINPKTEFLADYVTTTYYDYDGYPGYDGYYQVWDLLGNTSIIEIPFIVGRTYRIGTGWFTYVSKTDTSYRFNYSHGDNLIDGGMYDLSDYITERDNFTIAYNEKLQAFTSFYSFLPDLYISHARDYFTSENSGDLWQHNIGERYNTFYGITSPTTLKIITNLGSQIQAEYTNIKFFAEIWNQYGELIPNETITNISLKDSTQISDDIILYPLHLPEATDRTKYVLDTSALRMGTDWYTGKLTGPEGLVISNNQLYRNTSLNTLSTQPPATGWSIAELCNIRKTNNHWITQLPRFLYHENLTNNHEYALSNRFRSDWLEITLELKDVMPGINLYDRKLRLSDLKLVYTPLQF